MLVLSRKPGECILIGDDVEVRVTRIRGNRVQLAIEAPPAVPIRRSETAPHSSSDPAHRRSTLTMLAGDG